MEEGGPLPTGELRLADQREAVTFQAAPEQVQPVDVDRQVVKPFAAAGEEALDEAPPAPALDQLHLVARQPEADEVIGAVPAELLRTRHLDGEGAPEPGERGVDRAH